MMTVFSFYTCFEYLKYRMFSGVTELRLTSLVQLWMFCEKLS